MSYPEKVKMAYCGIICEECPAFVATKNDDDLRRQETAEMWSKQFNVELTAESINCEGCLQSNGMLFNHCFNCEIRKCAINKQVENCAYCSSFICEILNEQLKLELFQHSRARLIQLHKDLF